MASRNSVRSSSMISDCSPNWTINRRTSSAESSTACCTAASNSCVEAPCPAPEHSSPIEVLTPPVVGGADADSCTMAAIGNVDSEGPLGGTDNANSGSTAVAASVRAEPSTDTSNVSDGARARAAEGIEMRNGSDSERGGASEAIDRRKGAESDSCGASDSTDIVEVHDSANTGGSAWCGSV
eukprot:scaffold3423_cov26-Tisochrysis_lutea.AAC.1